MNDPNIPGFANMTAGRDIKDNTITYNIVNNVLAQSSDYNQWLNDKRKTELLLSLLPKENIDRNTFEKEIEELNQKIDSYEQTVKNIWKRLSETNVDSERKNKASKFFAAGKISEAQAALDEKEIQVEYKKIAASIREKQEDIENDKKKILELSEQILLKAELALLNYEDANRLKTAERFYKESIGMSKNQENLSSYAEFLESQLRDTDVIDVYEEILNLKEGLNQSGRTRILHNLTLTYLRAGNFKMAEECLVNMFSNMDLNNPDITGILLSLNTIEWTLLKFVEKESTVDLTKIELLINLRTIANNVFPIREWQSILSPLSVKTMFSISKILLTKNMLNEGVYYFEKSINDLKSYLFNDPIYPTVFHPNDLVLGIALNLSELIHFPVEKEKIDIYLNELLEITESYEKLITVKEDNKQKRETLFLSISMTYFSLSDISKDKEYELLKKAFTFNDRVELTVGNTRYFLGVYRRLSSDALGIKEYDYLYEISVSINRLFPYMNLDTPELIDYRNIVVQVISDMEEEETEEDEKITEE